jgi:hypothetical protein
MDSIFTAGEEWPHARAPNHICDAPQLRLTEPSRTIYRVCMRKVVLVGAWGILFAGTVGVRALWASRDHDTDVRSARAAQQRDSDEDLQIEAELEKIPRRQGIRFHDVSPRINASITNFINSNTDGLLRCRDLVMRRSPRPTEHFELSFMISVARNQAQVNVTSGTRAPSYRVTLVDPMVERSTVALTSQEMACISGEFAKIAFDIPVDTLDLWSSDFNSQTSPVGSNAFEASSVASRGVYQLCFRGTHR